MNVVHGVEGVEGAVGDGVEGRDAGFGVVAPVVRGAGEEVVTVSRELLGGGDPIDGLVGPRQSGRQRIAPNHRSGLGRCKRIREIC